MAEKALIIETSWDDNDANGQDILVRIDIPDKSVILLCMGDMGKQVALTFEEVFAIHRLIDEEVERQEKERQAREWVKEDSNVIQT